MLALLLLAAQTAPSDPPESAEIVVVAAPRRCRVQMGGQTLSDQQLDRYAAEWANGREVRILVAPGASYRCMAKIMDRLADRGVRLAYFVDRPAVR